MHLETWYADLLALTLLPSQPMITEIICGDAHIKKGGSIELKAQAEHPAEILLGIDSAYANFTHQR